MRQDISLRQIRELEHVLQSHMTLYGYELIDVPIIGDANIFLTRAGNTIVEELFTFERFGKRLALRPEFTAAVAHRYVSEKHTIPTRWQLSGAIFVDEPSDYSLQYQQHNIGAELIGQQGLMADAEIIAMAIKGIQQIDVSDWQVIIGHVGLQLHLLSQFDLDNRTRRILLTQRDRLKTQGKQAVLDYLNDILTIEDAPEGSNSNAETEQVLDVLLDSTRYGSTMGGRTRHDIVKRLVKKHDRGLQSSQIHSALDFLEEWGAVRGSLDDVKTVISKFVASDDTQGQALLTEWFDTLDLLGLYGIAQDQIILQPDLTKNWDYYTGIVFGIRSDEQYIASGGRYDDLTRLLGGEDAVPAVGFAYYTETLAQILKYPPEPVNTLTLSSTNSSDAILWATRLRSKTIAVEIVEQHGTIEIQGDVAHFNGKTLSQDELMQELLS